MIGFLEKKGYFGLAAVFLLSFFSLLVWNSFYFLILSSCAVFLCTALLVAFLDITPFVFLLVASLPLSIKVALGDSGTEIIFPGELLEGWFICIYFLRFFTGRQKINPRFFWHPVTISILAYLFFTGVSVFFSTMPAVSGKAFLVKGVYIGVYYFLFFDFLEKVPEKVYSVFYCYGLALLPVIGYTLFRHAGFGFSKDTSGVVAFPFYSDHTIYGACIALILPFFLVMTLGRDIWFVPKVPRVLTGILSCVFIIAIFFSVSRATWVSLVFGLLMVLMLWIRVKPWQIVAGILSLGVLVYLNSETLVGSFQQNRYDSNARGAGLEAQTKSITNISNDESNGERINRWKSALRMIEKRPWAGFGPGTFQFQYLYFQRQRDMTRISITNPWHIEKGHGGTAHSEYLLVFSESGIFCFLAFISMMAFTLGLAIRNYHRLPQGFSKNLNGALLVGIVSYLSHAFFNNFLDIDKAAFLFWTSVSALVAMDMKIKSEYYTVNK